MSNVTVISKTQKIIVNPATSSVSVINAGPAGPGGPPGSSGASDALTINGQLLTRVGGALAGITREDLAADPAFTSQYGAIAVGDDAPVDPEEGDLWWDTDEPSAYDSLVDPVALANDATFQATLLASADYNTALRWNLPWGELSYDEITSGSVAISTSAADVIISTSKAWVANRRLLIVACADQGMTVTTPDSEIFGRITKADNTILRTTRSFNSTTNTKAMPFLRVEARFITTGAAVQFKLRVDVSTGSGTLTVAATSPYSIHVLDIGPNTATPTG